MRKLLLTTALIAGLSLPTAANAFDPVTAIIIGVFTYKGSQAANLATGGAESETLTQNSYDRCKANKGGCVESGIYTVAFLPVDAPLAVLMGKPELIGSHGETWSFIDSKLPTISNVRTDGYGGKNYKDFLPKRR